MQYCQYRIDDTFYPLVTARPDAISSFTNDQGLKIDMNHSLWTIDYVPTLTLLPYFNPNPTTLTLLPSLSIQAYGWQFLLYSILWTKITIKLTIY